MKVKIKEDTKILLPNRKHQSFSEGAEVIPAGTIVEGQEKYVTGRREGQPFTYRLFEMDGKKLVYLNKIEQMSDKTEVNLNATGTEGSTDVNLRPAEYFTMLKMVGLFGGAIAGFAYCKYKGGNVYKCVAAGAAIGYVSAFIIDTQRKVTVSVAKD